MVAVFNSLRRFKGGPGGVQGGVPRPLLRYSAAILHCSTRRPFRSRGSPGRGDSAATPP